MTLEEESVPKSNIEFWHLQFIATPCWDYVRFCVKTIAFSFLADLYFYSTEREDKAVTSNNRAKRLSTSGLTSMDHNSYLPDEK